MGKTKKYFESLLYFSKFLIIAISYEEPLVLNKGISKSNCTYFDLLLTEKLILSLSNLCCKNFSKRLIHDLICILNSFCFSFVFLYPLYILNNAN